jgi:type II secretory pathway component GspD/PulD (secretin)
LGYLFSASSASDARTELIALIRPTVLPTPEVAALAATAEKSRMPEARAMEKEVGEDEKQRLKAADKADKADLLPSSQYP